MYSNRSISNPPLREPQETRELSEKDHHLYQNGRTLYRQDDLVKRVNSLQFELENLNIDRAAALSQLHEERLRSAELQRKLRHSGKVQSVSERNTQNDLNYEKEENNRLRHLLHTIEQERTELRSFLKNHEGANSRALFEKQDLTARLQQKTDHIALLESTGQVLAERNSAYQSKICSVGEENEGLKYEQDVLREAVSQLETANCELHSRLHEESVRFDHYQLAKNGEFENVKWVQLRRLRLLAARNLGLELAKLPRTARNAAFGRFRECLLRADRQERAVKRLAGTFRNYESRRIQQGLSLWRTSLNSRATHKNRKKYIDCFHCKTVKNRYFAKWREAFWGRAGDRARQVLALTLLFKYVDKARGHSLSARFLQWKRIRSFLRGRSESAGRLQVRVFTGKLRSAIDKWKHFAQNSGFTQAKEDLTSELASHLHKGLFFRALRDHTTRKQYERRLEKHKETSAEELLQINVLNSMERYTTMKRMKTAAVHRLARKRTHKEEARAFTLWHHNMRDARNYETLKSAMTLKNKAVCAVSKDKFFYVWKTWALHRKHSAVAAELHTEKPLRERLETALAVQVSAAGRVRKLSVARTIAKRLQLRISSAVSHWRQLTRDYHSSLPRVYSVLKKQGLSKVSGALCFWRKQSKDLDVLELCEKVESTICRNSVLAQEIQQLKCEIEVREENRVMHAAKLLRVARGRVLRKDFLTSLRKWARHALAVANIDIAGGVLNRRLNRLLLLKSLRSILSYSSTREKERSRLKRLQLHLAASMRNTNRTVFESWLLYRNQCSEFRKRIVKGWKRRGLNLKALAVTRWKQQCFDRFQSELLQQSEGLRGHKETLEKQLEFMNDQYQDTSSKLTLAQNKLNRNTQKRLKNVTQNCVNRSIHHFFAKWRGRLVLFNRQKGCAGRVIRLWNSKAAKGAWRFWSLHTKEALKSSNSSELKRLHSENKGTLRAHKTSLSALGAELKQQRDSAQASECSLHREKQRTKFLLTRGIKQMQTEYSDNRATFAFFAWKDRFLLIKARAHGLAKRINSAQTRKSFRLIRQIAHQQAKLNEVTCLLIALCNKYRSRFIRHRYHKWHRNAGFLANSRLQTALKQQNSQNSRLRTQEQLVKSRTCEKFLGVLMREKKQNLFAAWVAIALRGQVLRTAAARVESRLNQLKQSRGISRLLANRVHSNKQKRLISTHSFNRQKRSFKEWKRGYIRNTHFKQVLCKVYRRHNGDLLARSLYTVRGYSLQRKVQKDWHSCTKHTVLSWTLKRHCRTALNNSWQQWVSSSLYRVRAQSLLKGVLLRALHRQLRRGLGQWQESSLVTSICNLTNTRGSAAIENKSLHSRLHIVTSLLHREGICPEYIETFTLERESLLEALERRGVHYNSLLPRTFLVWQMWVLKRKGLQKAATRIFAYRQHSAALKAFSTWKRSFPLLTRTISKLTRRELHILVARMDCDLKSLEGRFELSHRDLVQLQTYTGVLECHTQRGQNQSLSFCNKTIQAGLLQALSRWSVHTQFAKFHELLKHSKLLEDELLKLKVFCRTVEEENWNVLEENQELRQASLDGIAIADAFETLTKERERLSGDLAERAGIIRRLLEENAQLSQKLLA